MEPKQLLYKLEFELLNETNLKRSEYDWLLKTGEELLSVEGTDPKSGKSEDLKAKLNHLKYLYKFLFESVRERCEKIKSIMKTKKELFENIESSRNILNELETKLSAPITLKDVTQSALDTLLVDHSAISRQIDEQSGVVSQLLNTSELFLTDCEGNGLREYGERILVRLNILDAKWKQVIEMCALKKTKIIATWTLLGQVDKLVHDQEQWLSAQETKLTDLEAQATSAPLHTLEVIRGDALDVQEDIGARDLLLETLESLYTELSANYLTPDMRVFQNAHSLLTAWYALRPRCSQLVSLLNTLLSPWQEFSSQHSLLIILLSQIDARLTSCELEPDNTELEELKDLLKVAQGDIKKANAQVKKVYKSCQKTDKGMIQNLVKEYENLYKDLYQRVNSVPTAKEKQVQVSTLRFERDSSVQVDTLKQPNEYLRCLIKYKYFV
ncbi:dystonin-like [Diaphorina citri]|uniref:Dystonin-like n=1 Tax=Diaphorina citri TaxID=121845 RepID=A0A1S3D745_DIACI|nr:dystonin-like [Diaphorina citri]